MTSPCCMFIDESGDLGLKGSKYLILACLIIADEKPLKRIVKNARRHSFKKALKESSEIKANKSSKKLKKHLLMKLNQVEGAQVFYILLEKKKIYSEYLQNNKHKLYNFVAGKLARYITVVYDNVVIRIDKSKGKQILQQDFNNYFCHNLKKDSKVLSIEIHHSYSHCWAGLQFADLLAWSMFQKFEHGNDEYVDIITLPQEVYNVW